MGMPLDYIPEEFFKVPAAYGSAFDDMMKIAREDYNRQLREMLSMAPAAPNCTTCGTFAGCVCRKAEQTPMVCYLCDGPHDPRVAPPRVCTSCAKRYLL